MYDETRLLTGDFLRPRHRGGRKGFGLYSYGQTKAETSFTFFGVIVVGVVFFVGGLLQLAVVISVRSKELQQYGQAESHFLAFGSAISMLVMGSFIAHPGVIYWARRISAMWRRYGRARRHSA